MAAHGMRGTPEYRAWERMKRRCYDQKYHAYKFYGARGITVATEWLSDFLSFYGHIGPRPTAGHSLDRIDNTRGYEPGNVRWATRLEQANNCSRNRFVNYRGEEMTLAQAVRAAGSVISQEAARMRLLDGWSVEQAVEIAKAEAR